jgi:hypothetical protein
MIFYKVNNKDIVYKIETLNEKLDLVHKSIARLRVDLPLLMLENLRDTKITEVQN